MLGAYCYINEKLRAIAFALPAISNRGEHLDFMRILKGTFALSFFLVAAAVMAVVALPANAQKTPHSVHFTDNFSSGSLSQWQLPHPEDWTVQKEGSTSYLHMLRSRKPLVPRRPQQFALLKGINVGNFTFQVRLRRQPNQKSVMLVFDYVDSLHFYYTHISVDPGWSDPHHNGVFIVDGAPRRRIAGDHSAAALPDLKWHTVRVERNVHSGAIKVFVDNASKPLFSVIDHTFNCGRVGVGSFDETGDFTDVKLTSGDAGCTPTVNGTAATRTK